MHTPSGVTVDDVSVNQSHNHGACGCHGCVDGQQPTQTRGGQVDSQPTRGSVVDTTALRRRMRWQHHRNDQYGRCQKHRLQLLRDIKAGSPLRQHFYGAAQVPAGFAQAFDDGGMGGMCMRMFRC